MSISLNPSESIDFQRPLTRDTCSTLTITNTNSQPVTFKVKTTAPKLHCVRPNYGRIEPGKSYKVTVIHQALEEEPPLNSKCKDKLLFQSLLIAPEDGSVPLQELWTRVKEGGDLWLVHNQKLRVKYLPAEEKPVEAKPTEAKPTKAKPTEAKSTKAKPTEAKPIEEKPIEEKPIEEKPAEEKATPAPNVPGPRDSVFPTLRSQPIELQPKDALDFRGPLNQDEPQKLVLVNSDYRPVTFKVKTTMPNAYTVRPNCGRVDPGETLEVSVIRQPQRTADEKISGKLLIQSTTLTPDMTSLPPDQIWRQLKHKDENINEQKIKVTYTPLPEPVTKSISAKSRDNKPSSLVKEETSMFQDSSPSKRRGSIISRFFSRFRRTSI